MQLSAGSICVLAVNSCVQAASVIAGEPAKDTSSRLRNTTELVRRHSTEEQGIIYIEASLSLCNIYILASPEPVVNHDRAPNLSLRADSETTPCEPAGAASQSSSVGHRLGSICLGSGWQNLEHGGTDVGGGWLVVAG